MNLLRRLAGNTEARYNVDDWMLDQIEQFAYQGHLYQTLGLKQTLAGGKVESFPAQLGGHVRAVMQSPPAFGAQLVRSLVLSQMRFAFRVRRGLDGAGKVFTTGALSLLERPWPNATTGEFVSKLEWHAGLAGNAFTLRGRDRLHVLRPDWVAVIAGSMTDDPDDPEAQVIGYAYGPGGDFANPYLYLPEDVAHWSPLPDPQHPWLGMSWLSPVIREIQGDIAATKHKLKFFENGATPNLVVKGIEASSPDQFKEIVAELTKRHDGVGNAYRTLYLSGGADATVVGSNLQQLDFKSTQGASETRISVASRVPAPILGISEGLAGSSLNAGNYGQSRRNFADSWVYPSMQSLCAALAPLVDVPADAELWFDPIDMPFLREDAKDIAEIMSRRMLTIESGVRAGFKPETIVAAVISDDLAKLQHTGLFSVQLQEPGSQPEPAAGRTREVLRDDHGRVVRVVDA